MIVLVDPAVGGVNLGDAIIVEAVEREVRSAVGQCHIVHVSMHQGLRRLQRRLMERADLTVIGGSNMMNLRMWPFWGESRWKIPYEESRWMNNAVLFGVGWSGYNHVPNRFGVAFYRRILADTGFHSVRDSFTANKLIDAGIENVLNTACPTMWGFDKQHVEGIPTTRARSVISTVSDYNRSEMRDTAMLSQLDALYENLFVWPQSVGDLAYLRHIAPSGAVLVEPSLRAFDSLLSSHDVDYCGTRLHGGIRAMQHRKRSMIVSIDNRATELSIDTGIPTHDREEVDCLADRLSGEIETRIALPFAAIECFKESLRRAVRQGGS